MKKSLTVAEAGRLGGLKGGLSTSPAKVKAARANMQKAREAKLAAIDAKDPSVRRSPSKPRKVVLPDGREVSRQYLSQLRNPRKQWARGVTQQEIKIGRLKRQPCQECGKEPAEAHHSDYEKPREVVWLCAKHHALLHRNSL